MVNWLNYHHLLYFWAVAKEGSSRRASEKLHISQPTISAQIRQLEELFGEQLFSRSTRHMTLTESGRTVFGHAEEIFALGQELSTALGQEPSERPLRLQVGISDSVPKVIAHKVLLPVFRLGRPVRLVCREGNLRDLVTQLAAHQLDVVLAHEPSTSAFRLKTLNYRLEKSGVVLCASAKLAANLRRGFPRSLNGAPAVLPTLEMPLRRLLEKWLEAIHARPNVVAEVEDAALLNQFGAEGLGFIPVYSAVLPEINRMYDLEKFGVVKGAEIDLYAITAERKIRHPAVEAITANGLS
jgi:LysR family transcriptional regulator, transcriptional activator of nhaA